MYIYTYVDYIIYIERELTDDRHCANHLTNINSILMRNILLLALYTNGETKAQERKCNLF